jgi:hypothetical protein
MCEQEHAEGQHKHGVSGCRARMAGGALEEGLVPAALTGPSFAHGKRRAWQMACARMDPLTGQIHADWSSPFAGRDADSAHGYTGNTGPGPAFPGMEATPTARWLQL